MQVVYNGIDTAEYTPDHGTDVLERLGVDPNRPAVVFVGRITRQKGVSHLLDAAVDVIRATTTAITAVAMAGSGATAAEGM